MYRKLKRKAGHTYLAGLILLGSGQARGAVTTATTILSPTTWQITSAQRAPSVS